MIKRLSKNKEEKTNVVRRAKKSEIKCDFDSLTDAVVDDKFTGVVGDKLIVVRLRDGRKHNSLCVVRSIEVDSVHTWDETREQWFIFEPSGLKKHGIVVKKSND